MSTGETAKPVHFSPEDLASITKVFGHALVQANRIAPHDYQNTLTSAPSAPHHSVAMDATTAEALYKAFSAALLTGCDIPTWGPGNNSDRSNR